MIKTAIKTVALLLCAVMLAGCSSMPFFDSSEISLPESISEGIKYVGRLISSGNGKVTEVEQTEIVEYTVEFPMCYYELTGAQQRMYRIMLTAAEDMIEGWIGLGSAGNGFEDDVALAYRALTCDYPEIFWLPSYYLISSKGYGSSKQALIAFSYNDGKNSCNYLVTKEHRDVMKEQLEGAINSYVSGARQYVDSFSQELYVHDRICSETEYKTDGDSMIYTSYGALINGEAVCEGYSRAMQLICNELQIPCLLIYGESEGEGHMWNLINPADGWYHLDVTWDDGENVLHTYFNATDEDIKSDHIIAETYEQSGAQPSKTQTCYNFFDYKCESELLNFFDYTNAVIEQGYSSAAATVYSAANDGKGYTQLKIKDAELEAEFAADYNGPAADLQEKLYKKYGINAPVLNAISVKGKYVTLFWE